MKNFQFLHETAGRMVLSEFIHTRYVPYIREHKRSWQTDVRYVHRHILPYLGDCRLEDIDEEKLCRWKEELLASGLSHNTCYRLFWLVKYILNCAVRWHVLASDEAFRHAVCRRSAPRCPEVLSSSEKQRLIALLNLYRNNIAAQAIHLLLLTGASKSESLYARREDVDLPGRSLAVRRGSEIVRRLPLSEAAVRLIAELPVRADVPWLFFRPATGERVVTVFAFWDKLRRELGRPTLRLNDLRHIFVHSLLQNGATYKDVRSRLGHYSSEAFLLQSQMQGGQADPSQGAFQ